MLEVVFLPYTWAFALCVVALASLSWAIIYRLYLSPIAKFPGRKLAALTLWYEFYYDVIKGGQYVWEIEKMHQKYGTLSHYPSYLLC